MAKNHGIRIKKIKLLTSHNNSKETIKTITLSSSNREIIITKINMVIKIITLITLISLKRFKIDKVNNNSSINKNNKIINKKKNNTKKK
jgi:hypothetical protein